MTSQFFVTAIATKECCGRRGEWVLAAWLCSISVTSPVSQPYVCRARTSQRICVDSHVHDTVSFLFTGFDQQHLPPQHAASSTALLEQRRGRTRNDACVHSATTPAHAVGWRAEANTRITAATEQQQPHRTGSQDREVRRQWGR